MISYSSGFLCHPYWDLARREADQRLPRGNARIPVGLRPSLARENQEGHKHVRETYGKQSSRALEAWYYSFSALSHGGQVTIGQSHRFLGPCYAHLSEEGVGLP